MLRSLYPPGWEMPAAYDAAIAAHWPGPLTILLPRRCETREDLDSDGIGARCCMLYVPPLPCRKAGFIISVSPFMIVWIEAPAAYLLVSSPMCSPEAVYAKACAVFLLPSPSMPNLAVTEAMICGQTAVGPACSS